MNNITKISSLSYLPSSKKKISWWLYSFLLCIFFFAQPFDLFYSVRYLDPGEELENVDAQIREIELGNKMRVVSLFSLGAFAVISLTQQRHHLKIKGALSYLVLMFLIWAFLSITWADDPFLTARRLVVLGMLCLGAWALAERFSFREIIEFAFFSGCLSLILGLLCEIILGTLQPMQSGYRFGGEMHPIYQAYNCGMITLAAIALANSAKRRRFIFILSALIAALCLMFTKSRGPMISVIFAATGFWWLVSSHYRKIIYLFGIIIVNILLYFSVGDDLLNYAQKAALLFREDSSVSTLTGRTVIWQECLNFVVYHPFLGYGYDSFWTVKHVNAISIASDFPVPDVHNVIIDFMLGLGIIGTVIYVLILSIVTKKIINIYNKTLNIEYAFGFALLTFFIINSFLLSIQLKAYIPTFLAMTIIVKLAFEPEPSSV
jgi:exopolysaccharide production protein ExoQ